MNKFLFALVVCASLACCRTPKEEVRLEALFMQYACGDWNDDMRVKHVSDSSWNHLVGLDIDPVLENGDEDITDLLWDNKTEEYGATYLLVGYFGNAKYSSCDDHAPQFIIKSMHLMDGTPISLSENY